MASKLCMFVVLLGAFNLIETKKHYWPDGRSTWYYINFRGYENCDYRGYAPGGKPKDPAHVKAPTAECASSGITNILGGLGGDANVGAAVANAVGAFSKKYAQTAPQVGAALGLFGAAFGALSNEPGPQDILDAVNAALGDLSHEVNDALDSMKGYIDTLVINTEHERLESQWQYRLNMWKSCTKENTEAAALECQRDTAKDIVDAQPLFTLHKVDVMAGRKVDSFDRRELEANLVLFRNYANLVIMELVPLINVYCNETATTYSAEDCKRFSRDLNEEVNVYIKYAQNAVKLIKESHARVPDEICGGNVDCGGRKPIYEGGWGGVHTFDAFSCDCTIDDSNTGQKCKMSGKLRVDGKSAEGYIDYLYTGPKDYDRAVKENGGRQLKDEARRYQEKNGPVVAAYWNAALLNMIPVWKEALKKTEFGMNLQGAYMSTDEEDLPPLTWYQYSPRYHERRKMAGFRE